MGNWAKLNNDDSNFVWNFVYNKLLFKPIKKEYELVKLPFVNKCYDISKYYNEGFIEEYYDNLHECTLQVFRQIDKGEKLIYALNWQHESYSFNPTLPFEKDEFNEWLIPVFPNGDYIFFLTKDLKDGIFADGINLKITLFGENCITSFAKNFPKIFV
jgi:hypothetical protein